MSDFLTNLAARSLGTAEMVKPRVPSLFEPARREGGLRPGFTGWQATREVDEEAVGMRHVERVDRQETTLEPLALQPHRVSRTGATEPEVLVEEGHADHPSHVSESRHGAPSVARGRKAVAPPAVSGFAPLIPVRSKRAEGMPERVAAESAPEIPAVRRLERAVPLGVRTFDRPAGTRAIPVQHGTPVPFSSEAPEPIRQSPGLKPPPHAISLRETTPRPAAVKAPATPQPEPSVQVTIGRVEVRAIFPEAPAASMPAPRARPTVSLDEYLKRAR